MLRSVASRFLQTQREGARLCIFPSPSAGVHYSPGVYRQVFSALNTCMYTRALGGRFFASQAHREKADRHSVEGRYGHALFSCAQAAKAVDQVYADVQSLKQLFETSSDFLAFAITPGITADVKVSVVQEMADKFKLNKITKNFLCTVAENKRMKDLQKIISVFEGMYRAARGEVQCSVTSATELTSGQKKEVIAALQKKAGPKATILADFHISPSIAGGLLVRMGDEVLDYTVATRLESLRNSLMAPINA